MKSIERPPEVLWKKGHEGTMEVLAWMSDPDCKSIVDKYLKDYVYWDTLKYVKITGKEGLTIEKLWSILTFRRELSGIPVTFHRTAFKFVQTNHLSRMLHEFDMNFGGNIQFDGMMSESENDKRKYLISSLMEEAIASSQIEGAVTTRKKAKEMLRKNLPPRSLSEKMILNNYLSIKMLSELKGKKLTPELLLAIHQSITKDTLENHDDEGRFRQTDDVHVVDSIDNEIVYTPPTHQEIPEYINALCNYFNTVDPDYYTHPVIKGCIIHFMIGWIHPFADGNGRTARALFYLYLMNSGYWLIEYMSISRLIFQSKAQYARAYQYTETDRNDLTYFINYKVKVLHQAFESLLSYLKKKSNEKKKLQLYIKSGHLNQRQSEIIKMLHDDPDSTFTVKELLDYFNVADQTIRNDLFQLIKKRIVAEIPINKKSSVYGVGDKFEDFILKTMARHE